MPVHVSLDDLLAHTEWERQTWHAWFREHEAHAFTVSVGPHGDDRFATVGDALFEFSRQSRQDLREFIIALPSQDGDTPGISPS